MFRVTNAAPVGGLILAYIILFCREKKVGQLFLHAAIVLFGTALVVVPFCLYFLRVGAFDLFIYASITHNFFYATGGATARDAVGWLSIIGSVLFVPCFFAAYRRSRAAARSTGGRIRSSAAMPPSARPRWRSASPTVIIFSISRLRSLSFSPSVSTGYSVPRPENRRKAPQSSRRGAAAVRRSLRPAGCPAVRQGGLFHLYASA